MKTHLRSAAGSTILMAAAQETSGTSAFWTVSRMASDVPESVVPTIAVTLSSSMSFLAASTALVSSLASS